MGLRISEGVDLEIGDIDGKQLRVHIRDGKGGKDRYMPLPVVILLNLRRLLENPRRKLPRKKKNLQPSSNSHRRAKPSLRKMPFLNPRKRVKKREPKTSG